MEIPPTPFHARATPKPALAWLTAVSVLAVLAALWPRTVALRSDDFGYVESVVAAIRGGWPATSDWLEPFNFILPGIGAAAYQATGSFFAATLGISFVIAAIYVWLLQRWVRPHLPTGWTAELTLVALALAPVALNKLVEFTGVPLSWTLTLGALLAWRARSPGWFFGLLLLGVLHRQSAVCLLTLPAIELALEWRRGQRPAAAWLVGLASSLLVIAGIVWAIPPNFARELAARHGAGGDAIARAGQVLIGLGALGGIAAAWVALRGERGMAVNRSTLTRPWLPLLWLGGGAVALSLGLDVRCETPALSRYSALGVAAAFGLSACFPRALTRVDPAALGAATLYAVLVAWRGIWWDYYMWDLVLLLALPRPARSLDPNQKVSALLLPRLILACWVVVGIAPVNKELRRMERSTRACELALREGRLDVSELSCASFGFMGWKVFPALRRPEFAGKVERLSDFLKFVEARRAQLQGDQVVRFAPPPERWSIHPSGERWLLPPEYRPRRFPLEDTEWRAWLKHPVAPKTL